MKTPEKTSRQLYDEFCSKYSVDQVSNSKELSMIYIYLKHRCSIANGNNVHTPPAMMRELIFKHLGHQCQLVKKENPALV